MRSFSIGCIQRTTNARDIIDMEPSECLAFVTTVPITAFETPGLHQSRDAHWWYSSPSDVSCRVSARGAREWTFSARRTSRALAGSHACEDLGDAWHITL